MGRPLKIAKANVTTITATTITTNVVTVSSTANFSVGQSFVAATTVGGITGGTVYVIQSIIDANNLTLTDPINWRTGAQLSLTTTTGQSVVCQAGSVDVSANNPAGPTNTYGIVGGNTGLVGNQVLARVAIGVTGNGTITTLAGNAEVYGAFTDFANTVSVGSAITVGTDTVGFVTTKTGLISATVTATTSGTNYITSGTQTFFVGKPITFASSVGGLAANTVYFVSTIANTTAFTVSTSQSGPNVALSTTTGQSVVASQDKIVLVANASNTYPNTAWVQSMNEPGFIKRQKGSRKFLVTGATSGLTGACFTANVANAALTANTMNLVATDSVAANVYVDRISAHEAKGFGNTDAALSYTTTFNTAYAANTNPGQTQPVVIIAKV